MEWNLIPLIQQEQCVAVQSLWSVAGELEDWLVARVACHENCLQEGFTIKCATPELSLQRFYNSFDLDCLCFNGQVGWIMGGLHDKACIGTARNEAQEAVL